MSRRLPKNWTKESRDKKYRSRDKRSHSVENNLKSIVGHSGNADVDVEVHIETTAIAYAMLCTMHATGSLSDRQFRKSVQELNSLMDKNHRRRS
ncbi:hypothetical protein ACUXCC_003268 [Cytobacillus horneckiae]|uniref:Uncharacterized protein n=1 Tax=Cytobacillus horneckiae TaxID=549687 RepID=A0A2N0ZN60_9BACI|nr:hypothetical protein [Cytobacillus horneckiae]NRG43709.1 hypothetical protein [Bacillus sp. CRN 9]MBN6889106.1 hypothetical protein [Cytobacillus horneckiae]MCM3180707.1 hypothetical protein [Cytobacillus horneckiae]MEC1158311.1 hypothetical protein [Cytobacillus horneckiae]MED2936465.1 hypothetical protein [Cytobacillus horneckiae]